MKKSSSLSRAEPIEDKGPPAAPQASRKPAAEKTPSRDSRARASSANASAVASAPARRDLVRVPDVRAYYDYFAEETLASMGFKVRFVYGYQEGYASRGVTWATDPAIGTKVPRGSRITVYATPEDYPQPRL